MPRPRKIEQSDFDPEILEKVSSIYEDVKKGQSIGFYWEDIFFEVTPDLVVTTKGNTSIDSRKIEANRKALEKAFQYLAVPANYQKYHEQFQIVERERQETQYLLEAINNLSISNQLAVYQLLNALLQKEITQRR